MDSEIYLDNGILSKPSSYLTNQMQSCHERHWHSLTAPYLKGKEPFASIERTLKEIYAFVGADEKDRFIFTSSGAEATAQAYMSAYIDHLSESGKNHILTTAIEEAPILLLGERFEKLGCVSKKVPLSDDGQLTRENLEAALSPRTGLVSLSWASSHTGVIHPIWELAELCREKGVLFHVDASSILGKLYFKFEQIPIDYLTFEGTLVHGPKGSGGLFVNRAVEFESLIPEGMPGAQLNTPALIGLGIAFEEMKASFDHLCMETARLRDLFEEGIQKALPETKVLFQNAERLPHITAIVFPGVSSELLAFHLREAGVITSFGGGRAQKLEHQLTASGIDPLEAKSALSFSLSRDTTEKEIRRAIGIIVDSAQKCRTFSEGILL